MDKKENLKKALDLITSNHWHEAHDLVQQYEGQYAFDRIHALLHRIEGDEWNAKWWYRKLKMEMPDVSFEEEVEMIKEEILDS